ncbi:unnamed protein product [Prunus armeniaca]
MNFHTWIAGNDGRMTENKAGEVSVKIGDFPSSFPVVSLRLASELGRRRCRGGGGAIQWVDLQVGGG